MADVAKTSSPQMFNVKCYVIVKKTFYYLNVTKLLRRFIYNYKQRAAGIIRHQDRRLVAIELANPKHSSKALGRIFFSGNSLKYN